MIEYETRTTEIRHPIGITCNKCGTWYDMERDLQPKSFTTIRTHFGFGSSRDGDVHLSHICETCQDKIVAGFKIPPEVMSAF